MRRFSRAVIAVFVFIFAPSLAAGQSSSSTQPSADAIALLNKIDTAYAKLQSAEFDGHVIGHFDVDGETKNADISFTSTFHAPNQFRHDAKSDVLLGSTGQTAYAFEPGKNVYLSTDAPRDRSDLSDWPRATVGILQQQNPSMLLALTKSASGGLKELGEDMTRVSDTKLEGISFPTLQFDLPPQHQIVTMLIDPKTSLLRQVRFDLRKSLEARGAVNVKEADVTIDYTMVATDMATDNKTFAWTPPAGATLASAAPATPGENAEATALVGKPAPDFTLKGLDDKPVKLSSLKGSVILVDFWAIWCAPCIASLPHIEALYKDQLPHGLKVLAVNQMEDKDPVKAFVDEKKLSLPVLLDSEGDAAKLYGADSIPETVLIGKDGTVKKVFIGLGPDTEEEIKSAVMKELGN
jgi:thiol-disulfide isomerase/thioredoxin/outer membrane lipoprotein-sorting protein